MDKSMPHEQVWSLLDLPGEDNINKNIENAFTPLKRKKQGNLLQKIHKKIKRSQKAKVVLPFVWGTSAIITVVLTISMLILTLVNSENQQNFKYTIYAAKPLVLGDSTTYIEHKSSEADSIEKIFQRYNCPMAGLGETFVKEAEKNNLPYWLVASIAFQESSCGKNTPKVDGQETYNAYGWGVWGKHVKQFDSWEHGIARVSQYMNEQFYSQGVTELCDIMKVYTPPSNGSWCAGVGFFRDQITQYSTPE